MIKEYRYDIHVECRYGDNYRVFISPEHLKSLIIDYDFDGKNSPIVLLSLVVDKNISDIVIQNKDTAKIYLVVYKYASNSEFIIKEVYIEEEFIYFVTDKENKTKLLDYEEGEDNSNKDYTTPLLLGLVKQEIIDSNKQNIMNEIFQNASVIDMICNHNKRKLLIEPPNDKIIDRLVITPITTFTDYIKYIDDNVNIYEDSNYRLFYDFDKTYIMSENGNPVYAKGENRYPIIIDIINNYNMESKLQGLDIVDERYVITVDDKNVIPKKDNSSNLIFNNLIGVNSDGSTNSTAINSSRTDLLTKTQIQRYNNDNQNNNNSIKSSIENRERILNIIKHNLDTSILTINKQYIINYQDKDEEYTGNYILLKKKEIFSREEDHFCITDALTLSKVK